MKKYFILILLVVVILVGEISSSPKTITGQRDGMNVWTVNHFFNTFTTEYVGPINDTTKVIIKEKFITGKSYMINVSDGNNVTLIKSKEIYNAVNVNDTIELITTYEPLNRERYKIKYTIKK